MELYALRHACDGHGPQCLDGERPRRSCSHGRRRAKSAQHHRPECSVGLRAMDDLADFVIRVAILLLPSIAVVAICMVLERRWPAASANRGDRLQNMKVWIASLAGQFLLTPALGGFTTLAVNAVGGWLIELPSTGWNLAAGVLAYLVAMDFGEYLFHRAQHATPALWEMHSLHHSDPELDATTAVRHFWFDPLLKTVTIWLAVGLLLKASPLIVAVYVGFSFYNFLTHANLHLGFG